MGDEHTPAHVATKGSADAQPQPLVPQKARRKIRRKHHFKCAVCILPPDILEEAQKMLIGSPGDPNAIPPVPASWTPPTQVSKWLLCRNPPHDISIDSIRYHMREHMGFSRGNKKAQNFVPVLTATPPPPTPFTQVSHVQSADKPVDFSLPLKQDGQRQGKRPRQPRLEGPNQPPLLERTKILDPDEGPVEPDARDVEVMDGPRLEEDKLDRLALAPTLPNSDLLCIEFAIREGAKTYAKLARDIRKRTDGRLSQQEAVLLTTGLPNLTSALASYRQTMAMVKGGRFGAPEVMDQKRGLKGLLQKDKAIIPGDVPPKNAEPIGVPTPTEEQLAPIASTLPFEPDALPESPPVPTFTLSDLPSPAAPASSPRPMAVEGMDGHGTAPMAKAVGDSATSGATPNPLASGVVVGDGGAGATVTPIKKWDAVV